MVILRSRWTRYSRIYGEQFTKQSTDSLSDRNRVKIRLYLLQVMNLLVGQECIWMFMFSFIHKRFYVFQRFNQNFPNWVCQKNVQKACQKVFSIQQNVAFWHFLVVCMAKSDNISHFATETFSLSLLMHDLSFCCSVLFNSIWSFSHWEILTRMSKHSLTLWNIVPRILSCLFCLQLKVVFELVDRPTQLICIWISILCQHTNTKDIAGQSAMFGHNMFAVLISWQTNHSQGQSQHRFLWCSLLWCSPILHTSPRLWCAPSMRATHLIFNTISTKEVLLFSVPLLWQQVFHVHLCFGVFPRQWRMTTFYKYLLSWKQNGAILHVWFNMDLQSILQYGVVHGKPRFTILQIAILQ